ncbi:hypothetical protein NPIL_531361 [Nephila pilipes]|uniref:Uncharacterized protein n=1 Tax=Nephila pilipes TaxID=299642 RepID=A0A8X6TWL0_NEPPI|nr:hypothetical protein NPIL_50431 [Nephila pilipes]GFT51261.1 hypothetical protein NPIL_531361 [Nephila pilipes]
MRWKRRKRRTLWSGVKRRLVKEKGKLRPGLQKLEWKRVKKRLCIKSGKPEGPLWCNGRIDSSEASLMTHHIPFLHGRRSRVIRLAEKRRSQTFSHFQRTICACTSSRARMLRDQVYDTAEQIYKGCPRTTSSPFAGKQRQ